MGLYQLIITLLIWIPCLYVFFKATNYLFKD